MKSSTTIIATLVLIGFGFYLFQLIAFSALNNTEAPFLYHKSTHHQFLKYFILLYQWVVAIVVLLNRQKLKEYKTIRVLGILFVVITVLVTILLISSTLNSSLKFTSPYA
ncbi:MAG TPA: hypothetical protein VK783_16310 [Bacteroidia bacterium]|jgi:hypothetical protein|nr:hypothetical protein [Bacteroidia bacterium]